MNPKEPKLDKEVVKARRHYIDVVVRNGSARLALARQVRQVLGGDFPHAHRISIVIEHAGLPDLSIVVREDLAAREETEVKGRVGT